MQVKTTWRFISAQSDWWSSQKQSKTNVGTDVGKREPLYTVGGNAN
jgi:hypothetical protein